MLMNLGDVLVYMEAWFKACPCHSTLALGVRGETYHRRRKAFADELLAHTVFPRPHAGCPMQSCKAPNAAAGEHWVLMGQWFAKCQQQVFIRSASITDLAEKDMVLDDFRVGRDILAENPKDKLPFTDTIPFKIAVIAHRDEFVAREGIRECFKQFAGAAPTTVAERPVHNRLSIKYLAVSSGLHDQMLMFLGGVKRSDPRLLELRSNAVKFKFMRMAEQSVEGRHAVGKANVTLRAHHHEATYSLGLRMGIIEAKLDEDPSYLSQFGAYCEKVRHPKEMAKHFRVLSHPMVAEALSLPVTKHRNQAVTEILRPIIYRCDAQTQFAVHKGLSREENYFRQRHLSKLRPVPAPDVLACDSVFRAAGVEHLRQSASPGQVFSVRHADKKLVTICSVLIYL